MGVGGGGEVIRVMTGWSGGKGALTPQPKSYGPPWLRIHADDRGGSRVLTRVTSHHPHGAAAYFMLLLK